MNFHHYINKRIATFLAVFSVILLTTLTFIPCHASSYGDGLAEPVYTTDGSLYPIVDHADLLTDDEEQELAQQIWDIQNQYQSAIVILTVDSIGSRSAMQYADDFYDYYGYGIGEDHTGTIFLLSMENRDYWMSTTGKAKQTYSDGDIEYITGYALDHLSAGEYFEGFQVFIEGCCNELDSEYNAGRFTISKLLICLAIGFGLALIPLFYFIGQLHTVHPQSGASGYSQGGLKLHTHSDRYVRSTISKTKIPKDSGGSSTHTGSSGTSHGGGGGHF